MTSKPEYTKKEYLESWRYLISQLPRIAPGNDDDAKRVKRISEELTAIVKREANTMFGADS